MQIGPVLLVTADEVCDAVGSTLLAQLPAALQALEDAGGPKLKTPATLEQVPTEEAVKVAAVPAMAVFSPGLADPPERDEDGVYQARWQVTVACYVRAGSYRETQRACRSYAAIIRAVLVGNPELGGIASGVDWTGEDYALIDADASRTLAGCGVDVEVTIDGAITDSPITDWGVPDPVVTSTEIEALVEESA